MADISSITLPGGGTYDLKDKNAAPKYGMGKNLLRNWYFVGGGTGRGVFPVNQRGKSSYVASSIQFGPDAWKVYSGSTLILTATGVTLSNGGVVVTDIQRNDSLWGRKVTLSVLTSGGIYTASGTMPSSAPASQTNILTISNSALQLIFRVYGSNGITSLAWWSYDSNVVYYAFKLELGSEQTLAHQENGAWVLNDVPDYEYEFYRCITSTADSTDTFANKSLATEQQLAYVESGTTASRNYTAGEYICWNGLTYTADTAIASGATFYTSGGNKNLTECVGGGFNEVNNKKSIISTSVIFETSGRTAVFRSKGNTATSTDIRNSTIPQIYRPSSDVIIPFAYYNGSTWVNDGRCIRITTNTGVVSIYNLLGGIDSSLSFNWSSFCATWFF